MNKNFVTTPPCPYCGESLHCIEIDEADLYNPSTIKAECFGRCSHCYCESGFYWTNVYTFSHFETELTEVSN